jgi:hypothetical protein
MPAILLGTALIPMFFYNITRESHKEIMVRLVEMRERKTELMRQTKLHPHYSEDDSDDVISSDSEEEREPLV